jgi:hypothetical protein
MHKFPQYLSIPPNNNNMNPTTISLLLLSTVVTLVSSGGGLIIPLATLTGHAGLYASSLTSAALMKLKAASAIAALAALTGNIFLIIDLLMK